MAEQGLLAGATSEFARTLALRPTDSDMLQDVAERITMVLGVDGAGVSMLESGTLRFVAASDESAAGLERAQEASRAGPGVEACLTGRIVTVAGLPDVSSGWTAYQRAVRDAGIAAVASIPLRHEGVSIGAVDLFSSSPRDWSDGDLRTARILADMATGYLVLALELDRQCRVVEQLQTALDSRIVIEQAKGILAAAQGISVEQAFGVLRGHARSRAVSIRSVAEAVVNLGLRP